MVELKEAFLKNLNDLIEMAEKEDYYHALMLTTVLLGGLSVIVSVSKKIPLKDISQNTIDTYIHTINFITQEERQEATWH